MSKVKGRNCTDIKTYVILVLLITLSLCFNVSFECHIRRALILFLHYSKTQIKDNDFLCYLLRQTQCEQICFLMIHINTNNIASRIGSTECPSLHAVEKMTFSIQLYRQRHYCCKQASPSISLAQLKSCFPHTAVTAMNIASIPSGHDIQYLDYLLPTEAYILLRNTRTKKWPNLHLHYAEDVSVGSLS